MRYVRYLLLALIALILITVAFANRQVVSLTILPQGLEPYIGLNGIVGPINLPLYLVVFGGVGLGLILGFLWEWIRESKHRRDASAGRSDKAMLESQVKAHKAKANEGKDELLVMVEEATSR